MARSREGEGLVEIWKPNLLTHFHPRPRLPLHQPLEAQLCRPNPLQALAHHLHCLEINPVLAQRLFASVTNVRRLDFQQQTPLVLPRNVIDAALRDLVSPGFPRMREATPPGRGHPQRQRQNVVTQQHLRRNSLRRRMIHLVQSCHRQPGNWVLQQVFLRPPQGQHEHALRQRAKRFPIEVVSGVVQHGLVSFLLESLEVHAGFVHEHLRRVVKGRGGEVALELDFFHRRFSDHAHSHGVHVLRPCSFIHGLHRLIVQRFALDLRPVETNLQCPVIWPRQQRLHVFDEVAGQLVRTDDVNSHGDQC